MLNEFKLAEEFFDQNKEDLYQKYGPVWIALENDTILFTDNSRSSDKIINMISEEREKRTTPLFRLVEFLGTDDQRDFHKLGIN